MSKRTRKAKSVGRFGARYGVSIRRRIREVEVRQKADHACPGCGALRVHRVSTGIWQCRKCDYKFAGGAYVPETPGFRAAQRAVEEDLGAAGPAIESAAAALLRESKEKAKAAAEPKAEE